MYLVYDTFRCITEQRSGKENLKEDEEIIAENYDETEHHKREFNFGDSEEINDAVYDSEDLKAHIEAKFKVSICKLAP